MIIPFLTLTFLFSAAFAISPDFPAATANPGQAPRDIDKRCDGGDCTYGGTATTLTANTVTTTVLSITSVPCYITTYVTDSTTTTETVYSTDIITSTITEKGIITVIKYQPTPILKSSVYESVIKVTLTGTTFWQETQGSSYEKTITGDMQTITGGSSGGSGWQSNDKIDSGGNNDDWHGVVPAPHAQLSTTTAAAWTHVTAAGQGVTNVNAHGQQPAATAGGWATAGSGNTVAGNAGAVYPNGVAVNWNAGRMARDDVSAFLVVLTTVSVVLLFEVCQYMG